MQFEVLEEIKLVERSRRRDLLVRDEHTMDSFSLTQLTNYIEVSKVAAQVGGYMPSLSTSLSPSLSPSPSPSPPPPPPPLPPHTYTLSCPSPLPPSPLPPSPLPP